MTQINFLQDIIIVVADKDMEQALVGICSRPESLNTRSFSQRILVHPGRDPGCLLEGAEFLRSFQRQFAHALILFDRVGSGKEHNRIILEKEVEEALNQSGWGRRAAAIAIDPELEAWVWSDSPHVGQILGWQGRQPSLHQWLMKQKWLIEGTTKPSQPKEAMEHALRTVRLPRSSALYRQLAQQVGFSRCTDASFLKLKATLQNWFAK